MTDRKGVLVRFPPDVLADLDAEAKRTGKTRHDVILGRCRRPAPLTGLISPKAVPDISPPRPVDGYRGLRVGPAPVAPGSRLKKR